MTTPIITGSAHPTTAASELKIYAMQDTAPFGLLQYSRGISDAVPTPITHLQSPAAPISLAAGVSTNVVDFTGLTYAMCTLYVMDTSSVPITGGIVGVFVPVFLKGGELNIGYISSAATATYAQQLPMHTLTFDVQKTGLILQIKNTAGVGINVAWSLDIHRLTV